MSNCTDRIQQRCKKVSSACVQYELELPTFSTLTDCVSIEDTTQELYSLVGGIRDQIDLSALEGDCLTLPIDVNTKDFFQFLITTICAMKTQITTLQADLTTAQAQIQELQDTPCP